MIRPDIPAGRDIDSCEQFVYNISVQLQEQEMNRDAINADYQDSLPAFARD
jgi:hypothetical protein